MSHRMLLKFAAFLILLAPHTAPAQTRPHADAAETYGWHTMPLRHIRASGVLTLMHWDKPRLPVRPFEDHSHLPDGVSHVYALEGSNSLVIEATQMGFTQVRQVVKILDLPAFQMIPTVTFAVVPAQNAGLTWAERPAAEMEMQTGAAVTQAFASWPAAGHPAAAVTMTTDSGSTGPQTWTLPGYRLTWPRLHSDNSLTLWIEPRGGAFPSRETPHLQRGAVLAVKETASPNVTFIKVDY